VNESSGLLARLRRWADEIGRPGIGAVLKPVVAAVVMVMVFVASAALLDVRVAPDGSVHIGFGGGPPAADQISDAAGAAAAAAIAISREEFEEELARVVSYMEELFRSRSDDERQLLMAAIDERMQDQGLAMSQQLRGAVDAAFTDIQRQHEGDLGLVFSAIDELGVITGTELQRMNTILASLLQREPGEKE
jgi:ABC-type transport system involved in cytochrome bd biosynthesis fused ATPase/permease subunit